MGIAAINQTSRRKNILPDSADVALARESLRLLALNAPALQLLAIFDAAHGREARARAEMALSNRMTRRNIATQLWLIEDAVQRGNVGEALGHYDVALRVNDGIGTILFPILSAALEDRALWNDFTPYIRARSPWLGAYFRYAIRNSARPDLIAALATHAGGFPQSEEFRGLGQELVGQLIERKHYATAVDYYRTLPGANSEIIRSAALNTASTDPRYAPLTWQPSIQSEINTSVLAASTGGGNSLYSVIDPGTRGVIARKLMMLAPGSYTLAARQQLTGDADRPEITWALTCADSRKPVGAFTPGLDHTMRRFRANFVIPTGCSTQFLTIIASGGSGSSPAEIAIEGVGFVRR